MIDQNLDILLNSGEHYKRLENSDRKREIDMIKKNSLEMLNKLQEKSKQYAEKNQLVQKEKLDKYAKYLVGTRIDNIQLKYLTNLKRLVAQR